MIYNLQGEQKTFNWDICGSNSYSHFSVFHIQIKPGEARKVWRVCAMSQRQRGNLLWNFLVPTLHKSEKNVRKKRR